MTKKVPLECCVCGQDAGMFHQHHNRDTGYGICKSCITTEVKRNTPKSIKECYGIAGVNYAEQS